mmetsp:Transcript_27392/g.72301  ORF Transcript_27392/g.72301 Transcript_27392/m.72301 type:complete len:173 (+) Transcript_27392:172-690(+)
MPHNAGKSRDHGEDIRLDAQDSTFTGGGRAFGDASEESQALLNQPAKKNYFEILGVKQDCTDKELKRAYKALAVKLHPDKNPDDAHAQEKFADLSEAYNALSDPSKREEHMKELSGHVGWGWNAEAAKKKAANYQWNGDEMLFQIGGQLNNARCRARRSRGCFSCLGRCLGD